jgi:hypothetical protein
MIFGMYGSAVLRRPFLAGEPDITYVLFDIVDIREEAEFEVCWLMEDCPAAAGWREARGGAGCGGAYVPYPAIESG